MSNMKKSDYALRKYYYYNLPFPKYQVLFNIIWTDKYCGKLGVLINNIFKK